MTQREPYLLSWSCSWGLTVSVAVLGVAGSIAMFSPDSLLFGVRLDAWCLAAFAAMAALSIACANACAAAAMHAVSRDHWHWPTLAPALLCAAGFAVASNIAVHLGWSVLAADAARPDLLPDVQLVNNAALFLCFAKPAMAWIIEGRKAMDRAEAGAAAKADDERIRQELEARSANVTRFRPKARSTGHTLSKVAGNCALGLGALGAGLGGTDAQAGAPPTVQPQSGEEAPIVQMADARSLQRQRIAQARELHMNGIAKTEIARRLGVHRNTVASWLRAT